MICGLGLEVGDRREREDGRRRLRCARTPYHRRATLYFVSYCELT